MPSRTPSTAVTTALREYDSRLGVAWDDATKGWRLTWEGLPQNFVLHHHDGGCIQELSSSELLDLVRRLDARHGTLHDARKRAAVHRRRALAQVEADRARYRAEVRECVHDAVGSWYRGPKPFVSMNKRSQLKGMTR